jgi:hypothetical protein
MIDVPRGVFVQAVMSSCGIATTQKISSIRRLASQFTVQRRKPYSVRYEAVNAMLLNDFLKARRQIDVQQKQIEARTAGLQKVSAQLELGKPKPQMVLNDQ